MVFIIIFLILSQQYCQHKKIQHKSTEVVIRNK